MGQREVWRNRAEYWGTTHGVQGSALRLDRSSTRQTEGHGEGRHSKGMDVTLKEVDVETNIFYEA